ncbi:hypothetical protein DFH09DRAFT_1102651 [Mycena vulgaris]|nr:hypothetical protein DFH09DRAFT_1102651 [Mycena vulgaris]
MYYNVELEWMVPGAPADLTSLSLSLNMLASAGKDRIKDKTDRRRGLEGFEPRRAHELSRTQWWMPDRPADLLNLHYDLDHRVIDNFSEGARGALSTPRQWRGKKEPMNFKQRFWGIRTPAEHISSSVDHGWCRCADRPSYPVFGAEYASKWAVNDANKRQDG